MIPQHRHTLLAILLGGALLAGAAEINDPIVAYRQKMFSAMPLPGKNPSGEIAFQIIPGAATNLFDVPYLGAERDKLYRVNLDPRDRGAREGHPFGLEWRTRCNIHIPPGKGPFPVIIGIHGGAYSRGSKDGGNMWGAGMPAACMTRGIVWVKINYILGHGIHPQVQRDARELVRFLRANAAAYKINPHRIALMGSSAGGWLAGSSAFTTADDPWVASTDWRYRTVHLDAPDKRRPAPGLLLPGDTLQPRWPEFSARATAVIADFVDGLEAGSPDDPHFFGFFNPGVPGLNAQVQSNGHLTTRVTLSKPGTHLPNSEQLVAAADGTRQVPMFERLLEFVDVALAGSAARAPAPEARPNQRWFADKVTVQLVGSGPDAVIHYTTDGSEPTARSPRYEKPFQLTDTTIIKALTIVPGMKPSGVMTARFRKGPVPPVITAPDVTVLPPARVGEPYEAKFTAPGAARWWCAMQTAAGNAPDVPASERPAAEFVMKHGLGARNGLKMESHGATGILRGTPRLPGWTTVLVVAAHEAGQGCPVGGDRLYMLRIDPPADGSIPKFKKNEDQNATNTPPDTE
jgi:acetyl esterase/lipase